MLKVYLAGGFRSNWQDKVIKAVTAFTFLDPRSHSLLDKFQYTEWDLEAIRQCDIVFAFFEKSNPGGYALTLEIGFAKALGKQIIFVDEKSTTDEKLANYLGMAHACSDEVVGDLESGIKLLKSLAETKVKTARVNI